MENDGDDLTANINKLKIKLKDINPFASKSTQKDESSISLMIEEFISMDENESLTDEEILLMAKNPETSEVGEEAEAESYNIPPKQITFEEVPQSFDTLLTFFFFFILTFFN